MNVKKGLVTISLEGQGMKAEGLPLDGFQAGPYYDSEVKLRKGDILDLPNVLDINFDADV